MKKIFVVVAACLFVPAAATAQQQGQPLCRAPEYSQFDFWIGTWNVFLPNGNRAGGNHIEKINGCYLQETWTGAGASRGNSYNIYDASRGKWHQTWVDNSGLLLLIEGEFVNGSMILQGETRNAQGQAVLNRITWTPFTADSVQQLWETSTDGGSTWATAFDGRYVRQE